MCPNSYVYEIRLNPLDRLPMPNDYLHVEILISKNLLH